MVGQDSWDSTSMEPPLSGRCYVSWNEFAGSEGFPGDYETEDLTPQ